MLDRHRDDEITKENMRIYHKINAIVEVLLPTRLNTAIEREDFIFVTVWTKIPKLCLQEGQNEEDSLRKRNHQAKAQQCSLCSHQRGLHDAPSQS